MTAGRRQETNSNQSYSSGSGNDEKDGIQVSIGPGRKTNKPLMEKRRRARINKSISELESLIIIPSEDQKTGSSKLEKADILEITVRHLKELCTLQKSHLHSWNRGFNECIKKANDYLIETGNSQLTQEMTKYLTSISKNKMDTSPYFLLNLENNNNNNNNNDTRESTNIRESQVYSYSTCSATISPENSLMSPPLPPTLLLQQHQQSAVVPTTTAVVTFPSMGVTTDNEPMNLVIKPDTSQHEDSDLMWRPWSRVFGYGGRSRRKELLNHYCLEQQQQQSESSDMVMAMAIDPATTIGLPQLY